MKSPNLRTRFSCSAAAAALAFLLAGAAAADPWVIPPIVDYSAVWNPVAPETALYLGSSLSNLEYRMQVLMPHGERLEAFESWVENGDRRFGGLFRAGTGGRYLFTDLDAAGFETLRQAQFALGRRLIDVEVQLVDGARRYSGLWSAGTGEEQVLDNFSEADFQAQWQSLAAGWRLVAWETWWENDGLRFYGVFRSGAEADTFLSLGSPWNFFNLVIASLSAQEFRLVDLEIAATPDGPQFSGRFVAADPVRSWIGIYFAKPWLTSSNWLFNHGHEFSGVDLPVPMGVIDEEPTAGPMYMLDLEVTTTPFLGWTPNQLKPLNDSGPPGPPRP